MVNDRSRDFRSGESAGISIARGTLRGTARKLLEAGAFGDIGAFLISPSAVIHLLRALATTWDMGRISSVCYAWGYASRGLPSHVSISAARQEP